MITTKETTANAGESLYSTVRIYTWAITVEISMEVPEDGTTVTLRVTLARQLWCHYSQQLGSGTGLDGHQQTHVEKIEYVRNNFIQP